MYVAIEGVIGVGKTTLARLLHDTFQAELLLEVFEENPFLSDFYSDRSRYAFQTQIFFLLSRYRQQHSAIPGAMAAGKMLISDYTFDKDSLFASINLTGDELAVYNRVHEALAEKIPQPDLVVFLTASTDTLMKRIANRNRSYERHMDQGYIEELQQAYEVFFSQSKWQGRLLKIDTNNLNIISRHEDLNLITNLIRQALTLVPFQEGLPLSS